MKKVLVIGYGNTLRSDDGVGTWVAGQIAALRLPDVDVKTCHQLCPELAADIIEYETVILVDASANGEPVAVRESIISRVPLQPTTHNMSPEILQHTADELYGIAVNVRVFTVRGESFEFGSTLSPKVKRRAVQTIDMIVSLIHLIEQNSTNEQYLLN
ncbi:MAG: hydrogenase maturation protease [Bacteroidota bacterium]